MAVNFFEELVKTYFQTRGFFTIENVPYQIPTTSKIDPKYAHGSSDIDILAVHLTKKSNKIYAVSCKGHPDGIKIDHAINAISTGGNVHDRDARKAFRELAFGEWGGAFKGAVHQRTGSANFVHVTACTKFSGDPLKWTLNEQFQKNLKGNALELLTLKTIWDHLSNADNKLLHQNPTVRHVMGMFNVA
ncbi:hypothetical protein [uncultured Sphingorhabdus sp.]|uniref:hypothetical protein n=1 Tax=uncultured Sphingorhabdus sp. TaxID=1686106 RepID=UPI002619ABD7|nr:hypothetical protein [uncultured Sphingorhabdus sp.]HMS21730.1 hypothetical protein [Sphingorhabdus sp.]